MPDRDVATHARLNAHVAGASSERAARHLEIVRQIEPFVRMDGVVSKVERRDELWKGQNDRRQVRVERARVRKRDLALDVVPQAHQEVIPETSIDAYRSFGFEIANHRRVGRRIRFDEQGVDVELRPYEEPRVRLEEPRLQELHAQALFRKDLLYRLEVVGAKWIEDRAGPQVDAEVAQASKEVVVLPAYDRVRLGLDFVELRPPTKLDDAEPRGFDLHVQGDDARRWIGKGGEHLDRREHLEVEQGLCCGIDGRRRVRLARFDGDGAAQRCLSDLLNPRSGAVGVEAFDRDRAEDGRLPRSRGEGVVDRMRRQVRLGVRLHCRMRISAIGQRSRHGDLRLLVRVLVEALALGERLHRGEPHVVGDRHREAVHARDSKAAVECRGPLVDDDLDAHVLHADVLYAGCAGVRLEEAVPTVVALDPGEVPLQRRRVEDLVVVCDATEDAAQLGARRRCEFAG